MGNEFKKFIAQGSVLDLAVGVIIGGAFAKIINSLVADIFMPIIGLFLRGVNVAQQFISLNGETYANKEEAIKAGAAVLSYGNFLQASLDFICIAFVLFLVVKQANKYKKPVPVVVVT